MSIASIAALACATSALASSDASMKQIVTTLRVPHGRLLKAGMPADLDRVRPLIVGGTRIGIEQAPWQVLVLAAVSEEDFLLCGGSILNATEILTAGHCVFNPETRARIPADQMLVIAGTADLRVEEPEEQLAFVDGVRVHPYYTYDPEATEAAPDDVSVLSLEQPLSLDAASQPIALTAAGTLLEEGSQVNLTGFGVEDPFTEEFDGELHSIGMTVGSSRECGGEADALFVCASAPNGSDCFGDSGSGLTTPGSPATLVGVTDTTEVIEGEPCLDGSIGGFANVAAPEIRDFIVEDSAEPPHAPRGGGVSIHGAIESGGTLSCEPGSWTNNPTFVYLFVDTGDDQVLQRGLAANYQLTAANIGQTIACDVQAENAGGTGVARTYALPPIRRSLREEEEERAAAKKHEEEALAKKHEEEAAAKKHEEEAASQSHAQGQATDTSAQGGSTAGSAGVAGLQVAVQPTVPDAVIAGSAFTVSSKGVVDVEVSCPASAGTCVGTVTLRTLGAVTARSGAHRRSTLTLASGSFIVADGKPVKVRLHLSVRARELLAHAHVLHVRATVVARDPAGASHTSQLLATLRSVRSRRR